MSEFDELLHRSFDAHAAEIDRVGGLGPGLAARSVRAVRRRRAWRAGATGGIAVTATLGVVTTAMAVSGNGGGPAALPSATAGSPSATADSPSPTADPYSLGACTAYIPANGALLPDGIYEGRAYVDSAAGFAIAVMPDGTVTRVQPGPNGDYPFDFGNGQRSLMPWAGQLGDVPPMVIDRMSDGTAGGDVWVDANPVGWDWTVVPGSPAPEGVNVASLYQTLAGTFGFGGKGYDPGAVPAGASAAVVAVYADGREVWTALTSDSSGPTQRELDVRGLAAVALRVVLPGGQAWEVRADYTPGNVPSLPCQPTPPSRAQSTAPTTTAAASA